MRLGTVIFFCAACVMACPTQAYEECGELTHSYGPYDYRTEKGKVRTVESNHFNSDVQNLRRGMTGSLGQELEFVLLAFPNHHPALIAMGKLGDKLNVARPSGATYPVPCYFDRA